MREPLLILDADKNIQDASRSFCELFRMNLDQVRGMSVFGLQDDAWDVPTLEEFLDTARAGKPALNTLEFECVIPGLGHRCLLFSALRIPGLSKAGALTVLSMEDISERKFFQQRTDVFMSMASHELKTPVTTLKTLVQILQKRFEESDDHMLVDYLIRMDGQIDQLTKLVTDLLDVSKIKAGKFELPKKVFALDPLVEEIIKNCRLLSPQHAILFKGHTHAKIKGDRTSIGRVLINLIVNAIKYSPNANKVIVTLARTTRTATVSVQDFGIGIEKQHRDKIFKRFFQVTSKEGQNFSGLGIGLYISMAIAEQHKGHINVKSRKGKGSTFLLTLPTVKKPLPKKKPLVRKRKRRVPPHARASTK